MSYPTSPLKRVVALNCETLPETTSAKYEFGYIDIGNVDIARGVVATELVAFRVAPSRARRIVRTGDVIISTVRTYLKAIAQIDRSLDGYVCSTGFAVLRPRRIDSRYLGYATREQGFVAEVVARSTGISYPAINAAELVKIAVPAPPAPRQREIAGFLDRECERIALLHASLEQLESGATEALRNWVLTSFGDTPHITLRRVVTAIHDGPFGSSLASEHYVQSPGIRVIRLGDVGLSEFRPISPVYVEERHAAAHLAQHRINHGDVIMAGLGDASNPLGRAAVVPVSLDGAIHKADCYRIQVDSRKSDREFVAWLLSFGRAREHASLLARGSTRPRLNTVVARDLPVPDLPLHEQRVFVRRAIQKRSEVIGVGCSTTHLRRRLTEYRDALITEVVTGQLDITAVSESQMDERIHEAIEAPRV